MSSYTHGSVAASVRRQKELRPQDYCHDPKCLWRVTPEKPCPKHGTPAVKPTCSWCHLPIAMDETLFMTPAGLIHVTCRSEWAATEQMQSMDGEC